MHKNLDELKQSIKIAEECRYSGTEGSIKLAMQLTNIVRYIKMFLAIVIVATYFSFPEYLNILFLLAIVLLLVSPYGFMHNFIQELIEYNTCKIEDRQRLNAAESNHYFAQFDERLRKLEAKEED